MEEIVYQVIPDQKPIEIAKKRPAIIFNSPTPKNKWLIEINEDGIKFNHEEFPNATADDFAKAFVEILETQYALLIGKRLIDGVKEEKSPWISVDAELPENMDVVICLSKRATYQDIVTICFYDGDYKDFSLSNLPGIPIKVDYWMPIPKSPKERP